MAKRQVSEYIKGISEIYSKSIKKFISINSDRYINVDDLYRDLLYEISKWDGHAYITSNKTWQDTSEFCVNSHGNAYLFVSENAKLDKIYDMYDTIFSRGADTLVINLLSFYNEYDSRDLLIYLILPFAFANLETYTLSTNPETLGDKKLSFEFNSETGIMKYIDNREHVTKEFNIYKRIPNKKIMLILSPKIAPLWYKRLAGTDNFTINCQKDCKVCTRYCYATTYLDKEKKNIDLMFIFESKYMQTPNDETVKLKIGDLPKKYRPRT
jgi:hypothetical protein